MEKIRLLVAEDGTIMRMALVKLLESYTSFCVVGEAGNGNDLIEKYSKVKPDVILIDISMPIMNGLESSAKILNQNKNAKIILFTMQGEEDYLCEAIKIGVCGYITKSLSEAELRHAIQKVYEGGYYFPGMTKIEIEKLKKRNLYPGSGVKMPDLSTITKREKEILLHVAEGNTSMEIASKLNISRRTVDFHRAKLLDKLNLKSSAKLIKYAVEIANNLKVKKAPHPDSNKNSVIRN